MSAPQVAVLGTRYQDLAIEEAALAPFGATLVSGPGDSPEAILAVAAGADVVLAGSAPKFTAEVLAGLRCRGVVRYGVGTDSVDLDAARRLGIAVARVSDYGTEAVAFHAVASACALVRRLPDADRATKAGAWGFADLRPLHLPSSLTAGVVGFGRIGRQAATYLLGLGFDVCCPRRVRRRPGRLGRARGRPRHLLASSDVVLLHAPGNADGSPLLGADELSTMRPGSVLVNTARGSLVDVPALVAALAAGRPAARRARRLPQRAGGRLGVRRRRRRRPAHPAHVLVHRRVRARHAPQGLRRGRPAARRRAAPRPRRRTPPSSERQEHHDERPGPDDEPRGAGGDGPVTGRRPAHRQHRAARPAPAQRHRHDGGRAGRPGGRGPARRGLRALRARTASRRSTPVTPARSPCGARPSRRFSRTCAPS